MGTTLQKKLAKELTEVYRGKRPKTRGEVIRKAGYSKSSSLQTSRVIDSPGVTEELENFGLTPQLIKSALVEDIKAKPRNRTPEMRLGAEILHMNEPDEMLGRNIVNNIVIFNVNDPLGKQAHGNNSSTQLATRDTPDASVQQPSEIQGTDLA